MAFPKLSIVVAEPGTGRLLAGVPIMASAEMEWGQQIPLGWLASDQVGYVSFDLAPLPTTGNGSSLIDDIVNNMQRGDALDVAIGKTNLRAPLDSAIG